MDIKENFKFKSDSLSFNQIKNIESNWLLIVGGLNEFKKHKKLKEVNKYGIIHMIRQIDGYNYYPITYKLFTLLNKELSDEELEGLKTDEGFIMNSKLRTRFNKFLKRKNIKDSIQIEHLEGGVKTLVERIITSTSEISIAKIKDLHRDYTLCCYKLKSELDINESTELVKINLASKP